MDDLSLGDAHLIDLSSNDDRRKLYVALLVVQKRNRDNSVSGINLVYLAHSLSRVRLFAEENRMTVHCPRLGAGTPNFNWYGVERLLKRSFLPAVPTYVYYFQRGRNDSRDGSKVDNTIFVDTSMTNKNKQTSKFDIADVDDNDNSDDIISMPNFPPIFKDFVFLIHPELEESDSNLFNLLKRNIFAYGGDVIDLENPDNDVAEVKFVIVNEDISYNVLIIIVFYYLGLEN